MHIFRFLQWLSLGTCLLGLFSGNNRTLINVSSVHCTYSELSSNASSSSTKSSNLKTNNGSKETDKTSSILYSTFLSKLKSEYRMYKMKNDITVLLTSQMNVENCEIYILNMVGFSNEPEDLQSMAFILMTSISYASNLVDEEYGVKDFVEKNSGTFQYDVFSNHSTFELIVPCNIFEKALEFVGNMFLNPAISTKSLRSSVQVIESELISKKDARICESLFNYHLLAPQAQLGDYLSAKYSRNAYCYKNTMEFIRNSNEDAVSAFKTFFENNYSANRLFISLKSNFSLDKMSNMVDIYFSGIANKKYSVISLGKPTRLHVTNPYVYSVGKIFILKTTQKSSVSIFFPLKEYTLPFYKKDPLFFLLRTVTSTHYSKSLLNILKGKGMVSHISLAINEYTDEYSVVEFTFTLNKNGIFNLPFILGSFFHTVNLVIETGYNLDYYRRTKKSMLNHIMYSKNFDIPFESGHILSNYLFFGSKTLNSMLLGQFEFSEFDPQLANRITKQINPNNMIIKLSAESRVFDQYINSSKYFQSCTDYKNIFLGNETFNIVHLTEACMKGAQRLNCETSFGFEYSCVDINKCFLEFLRDFSANFTGDLEVSLPYLEKSEGKYAKGNTELNSNNNLLDKGTKKPIKLAEVLDSTISLENESSNVGSFNHLYYLYSNDNNDEIALFLSYSFPFHIERLLELNSVNIYSQLILLKDLFKHLFSEMGKNIECRFEIHPSVTVPSYSSRNVFAFNLLYIYRNDCKKTAFQFIGNVVNKALNVDPDSFKLVMKDFISTLKNYEETYEMDDILTHISILNSNLDLTSKSMLKETRFITIHQFTNLVRSIILDSKFNGFIYGNLTPEEARIGLSLFFSQINKDLSVKTSGPNSASHSRAINTFRNVRSKIHRTRVKGLTRITKTLRKRGRTTYMTLRSMGSSTRRRGGRTAPSTGDSDRDGNYHKTNGIGLKLLEFAPKNPNSRILLFKGTHLHSKKLSNLQILDISSLQRNTRLYFQITETNNIHKSFSILNVFLGRFEPYYEVIGEFISELADIALSKYVKVPESVEVSLRNYQINSNYVFFSITATSTESLAFINESIIQVLRSISESILKMLDTSSFFSSLKKSLLAKYENECDKNITYRELMYEFISKSFNFNRSIAKKNALSQLNYNTIIGLIPKIFNESPIFIYTIQRSVRYGGNEFKPCIPDGFTYVYYVNKLFELPGITVIKPAEESTEF